MYQSCLDNLVTSFIVQSSLQWRTLGGGAKGGASPSPTIIFTKELVLKSGSTIGRNREFLFFKYKTFASERSPWQQHSVNSSVRLPNHYTRAKLKKVLVITSKDIHYFIYVIYYSWVNDVKRHLICILKKPKYLENETRLWETENAI